MNNWQNMAPTTDIASPQVSSWRNRRLGSSVAGSAAMHSAPSVEMGDTSTSAAPTLMLSATSSALPPPSFSINPGTAGKNVGYTTPEVELYVEMAPVTKAIMPFTLPGLAILVTVVAINLLGDGLRDALDPRLKRHD